MPPDRYITHQVDATTIVIIAFAVGSSAPIIARGAWSLIDMGIMFKDVMYESYSDPNVVEANSTLRKCDVGKAGIGKFLAWVVAIFCNLMAHNVSFQKLTPYATDLFQAFSHNLEKCIFGQPIYRSLDDQNFRINRDSFVWSWKGWRARAQALLNIAVLNGLGFVVLILQTVAALGEGLLLALGSVLISLGIAANANVLGEEPSMRNPLRPMVHPDRPLKFVCQELICCETCVHLGENRNHLTGRSQSENTKGFEQIMVNATKRTKVRVHEGRGNTLLNCWNVRSGGNCSAPAPSSGPARSVPSSIP